MGNVSDLKKHEDDAQWLADVERLVPEIATSMEYYDAAIAAYASAVSHYSVTVTVSSSSVN